MDCPYRIGYGFDLHQWQAGRRLVLGGVKIPHSMGLKGHSDADVLTHAIIDALYGAAALGDIGRHFPDTDPQYKNADSLELLKKCMEQVRQAGYALANVDCTVVADHPKLAPHIQAIRQSLAVPLAVSVDQVNVKATRTESVLFSGNDGVLAMASVLVYCPIA